MEAKNPPQAAQQGQSDQNINPSPESNTTEVPKVLGRDASTLIKLSKPLNDSNWSVWKEQMNTLCAYVELKDMLKVLSNVCPLKAVDWDYIDNQVQFMLMSNITFLEMVHVSQCLTAKAMWLNLQAVHQTKSPQSTITVICNLFHTKAVKGENINEHLTVLQQYWEKMNMMQHTDFKMPNSFFKVIISSSLLSSWDTFTESYIKGCTIWSVAMQTSSGIKIELICFNHAFPLFFSSQKNYSG